MTSAVRYDETSAVITFDTDMVDMDYSDVKIGAQDVFTGNQEQSNQWRVLVPEEWSPGDLLIIGPTNMSTPLLESGSWPISET